MPESAVKTLRVPSALLDAIDQARGSDRFSTWALGAFRAALEGQHGLGAEYREELTRANLQLIAIGRNLNQLSRAANTGKPVTVPEHLVKGLLQHVRAVEALVSQVDRKLP